MPTPAEPSPSTASTPTPATKITVSQQQHGTAPNPPSESSPTPATTQSSAPTASTAKLPGLVAKLRAGLRQYPDFPQPGILFEDFLPLFLDPDLHEDLLTGLEILIRSALDGRVGEGGGIPDVIVGLESRGFLFGPSLALRMGAGFVPVRKGGKLPGEVVQARYVKEYGEDVFEMQKGVIKPGQTVVVVDDLIATGKLWILERLKPFWV